MTAIMVHPKHRIGSPPHILDMKKTLPTARDENDLYMDSIMRFSVNSSFVKAALLIVNFFPIFGQKTLLLTKKKFGQKRTHNFPTYTVIRFM